MSFTVLNQAVVADRTELRLITLVCDDAHSCISLAHYYPRHLKVWSGVKESVACVAGGIIAPGVVSRRKAGTRSERRNREGERWKSLLDLPPIFTWLGRQKSTASAAKSPATQAKESVSLRSLLRADPFPFFSP